MTNVTPFRKSLVLPLIALLVTGALAGCTGDTGGNGATYGSYEDAKSADGQTYTPVNGESPLRLKLLEPSDPSNVGTGDLDVVFLLYDSTSDEPVTDAQFIHPNKEMCGDGHSFCAEMPAMGHGTSPEESPVHQGNGVYKGMTHMSMDGEWILNVNPELQDGSVVEFDIDLATSS